MNPEAPTPGPAPPTVDPARMDAIKRRAKEILDSGRIPESLFACGVNNALLTFQPAPDQKPVMLLFSSTFAANDYLRGTGTIGNVGQFSVEKLPELARSWISLGVQGVVFNRCPRCPQVLSIALTGVTKWTKEDFAKAWAQLRAVTSVLSEIRIRSAMNHLSVGSHAAARSDLEYVRDHFDCGVPYLHQMIGLIAGIQQDEQAKSNAVERLKEFGPEFQGPIDFSTQLVAATTVGLLANFGIPLRPPG